MTRKKAIIALLVFLTAGTVTAIPELKDIYEAQELTCRGEKYLGFSLDEILTYYSVIYFISGESTYITGADITLRDLLSKLPQYIDSTSYIQKISLRTASGSARYISLTGVRVLLQMSLRELARTATSQYEAGLLDRYTKRIELITNFLQEHKHNPLLSSTEVDALTQNISTIISQKELTQIVRFSEELKGFC